MTVSATERVLRVLVVDDSAYVRKVVRDMLSRSPFLEVVGHARDGHEALELVESLRPDVVTCDLMMPQMDGVDFVRAQMARRAVPVVIISSIPHDEDRVLTALAAGAVDFVQKPTALANERMLDMGTELVAKVKTAAGARLGAASARDVVPARARAPLRAAAVDVVVLGISTGGPQALRRLIPQLPGDCPVPVAVGLHMPPGYTELYARKLDEMSAVEVREAHHGDRVEGGAVLLAPGGRHLTLCRTSGGVVVAQLSAEHHEGQHRPSIDVLFRSAAEAYGGRTLGVVMTGMGSDGREGAAWIKAKGGTVLTEAEETCVVYGMPRAVAEAGLSDASVPLERMAEAILERL